MKLFEIIEMVDSLVPNSVPIKEKVKWINQIQNNLFRDYPISEAVQPLIVKRGQQFFPLPVNCAEDRITEVIINDRHYPFVPRSDNENVPNFFCTFVSGTLMIYPAPDQQTTGFLYYGARPNKLSEDDMDAEPTFPEDFHNLLVFGCCSLVALTDEKTGGLSSTYDGKYQELANKADLKLTRNRQKTVNIVRGWR